MFKFGIVCVIAFVALQEATTRATTKPKTGGKSEIDELAANARQVVQNVSSVIEGNLPDSKQVSETLVQTSQKLATKVKDIVNDLNKQTQEHQKDIEDVITQAKQNLAETANKLQEIIGPDAVKKAKDIKANLDEGLNKAIAEAEKLAKAAEPEVQQAKNQLTNTAKTLLDQVVQVTKELQAQISKNVGNA